MKFTKFALVALTVLGSLATTSAKAGPVGGPKGQCDSVGAYATDSFRVSLYGGEVTQIIVDGDGDTDLDLFVYDCNGNLIGSDTDNTDYCVVCVRPCRTAPYTIRVVNRGCVSNVYTIQVR